MEAEGGRRREEIEIRRMGEFKGGGGQGEDEGSNVRGAGGGRHMERRIAGMEKVERLNVEGWEGER